MNKQHPKKKPRFTLIVNEHAAKKNREEAKRRAELQSFIKACEALYEQKQHKIRKEELTQLST